MSDEGILIVGSPRSGTTLLRRLLDAHPSIACPGETNVFGAAARFLRRDPVAEGLEFGVLSGLALAGFEPDDVMGRVRDLAFGFMEDIAKRADKPRWAEKSAMDAFYLDEIRNVCGERVRYVAIVRHGLDVAKSVGDLCDRNDGYLPEFHEYVRRDSHRFVAFAKAWVDTTGAVLELAKERPDQTVLVRYEDLVADPVATMQRIFTSIGEEYVDGLVETALTKSSGAGLGDWKTYERPKVTSASIDRWKEFTPATLSLLAPIVNPTLEAAGYDPVPARPLPTPEQARRRFELDLAIRAMRARGPSGDEAAGDDA